ncbi:FUSC family protein [Xanthomonas campestris pv. cannae]|nr:FUSC family protein [Xanthomonas campestris pv. cannae]
MRLPNFDAVSMVRLRPSPEVWFALRTTAAALLALAIALLCSMEDPKWAAMTVFIVAQADRGMSVVKARNRIVGTLVGASMAVVLMGLFGQAPPLFMIALALWLGACTGMASVVSAFRSYGVVLAGYTAVIVGMSSTAHPQQVFDIAVARATEILLGIAVEGVMASIFSPASPRPALESRLEAYLRQGSALAARLLRGEATGTQIHGFFASALALNDAVDYAAARSREIARLGGRLRHISYLMLAQLLAAQSCRVGLDGRAPSRALRGVHDLLVQRAGGRSPGGEVLAATLGRLDRRHRRLRRLCMQRREAFDRAFALEHARTIVRDLQASQQEQAAFEQGQPSRRRFATRRHRDLYEAAYNGVRAFLAMGAASLFWVYSGWSAGAGMVTIVGVVCALYATRPDPVSGSIGFLKGAGLAALAAFVCIVWLLPWVEDFAGLAAVLAPFLILAGLAMRRPSTAALGASGSIFFLDLVGPLNGTTTGVVQLFNGALTLLLGIGIGVLMFTVLLPSGAERYLRRLRRSVDADLAAIALHPRRMQRRAWFGLMADRMRARLGLAAALPEATLQRDLAALLGALGMGSDALDLARTDDAPGPRVRAVLRRLARGDLPGVAQQAMRAARHHAVLAGDRLDAQAQAHWRTAMVLWDMALCAREYLQAGAQERVQSQAPLMPSAPLPS